MEQLAGITVGFGEVGSNRGQSLDLTQEAREHKQELQLKINNVGAGEVGMSSGIFGNDEPQDIIEVCRHRPVGSVETDSDIRSVDREQEMENKSRTWWEFLRENGISKKYEQDCSKHCACKSQEQDQYHSCPNLEIYTCAPSKQTDLTEMYLDTYSRPNSSKDNNRETINLSIVNIDLDLYKENTYTQQNINSNNVHSRSVYCGENPAGIAGDSILSSIACRSFGGHRVPYKDADTVSLPAMGVCSQEGFRTYVHKHLSRSYGNEFNVKSHSNVSKLKDDDSTASMIESNIETNVILPAPSPCTEFLSPTENVNIQNAITSISQHNIPFPPNVNTAADEVPVTNRNRKSTSLRETPRVSSSTAGSGELRSTIMLVLVTSLTLLAELFVIVMLIFQFLDSIALRQGAFISTSQLAVMFSLSNFVTLLTFPLNFFIFCGLSVSFRDALRDGTKTVMAVFKKVLRRT
ncbi:hypothetical protein EGW08_008180 [Elysia chlorotica]|uniref:G-protein coupled receptors family 1 profile domain-containing protein n=1 Tax=Elysia chlorotica TaxID=188477 RepID=A0A433TRF2_ELYCH|nr:hypothetical protein EGW08_008180 [Elysia chlorotica]